MHKIVWKVIAGIGIFCAMYFVPVQFRNRLRLVPYLFGR